MILRDPVHGLIAFESEEDQVLVRLLQTREVQRLRRIRQLGLTSFAFPGAEHTRFSHALGAAHVMKLLVARLRQIDSALPFWQRMTSERARDALAAAFLHDLGHGPLSHLFEGLTTPRSPSLASHGAEGEQRRAGAQPHAPTSGDEAPSSGDQSDSTNRIPKRMKHEDWTVRMLLDESSEVHHVLAKDDAYLPQRVADLVRGKHELPYLARAVSGTFDVDRCDYLLRDAHATGVRYGDYDLPWLLRSLRFGDPGDANGPALAIDGPKGLAAIEEFILARLFMFQQVYFHKSTRAAEWMIGSIVRRALALVRNGERLPAFPPAFHALAAEETPAVSDYLELDDQALLVAIHAWESAKDPALADLSKRLRARALFKSVEVFADGAGAAIDDRMKEGERALGIARALAAKAGLDPDLYVGLDVASDVPYADDDALKVVFPRGATRKPSEVSFVLGRLKNERLTRVRVVCAAEIRDALAEAIGS